MKVNFTKLTIVYFVLSLVFCLKLEAQPFDCPDDFDEYNWTKETTAFTITTGPDNAGSATITEQWISNIGGVTTILIDWSTFTNNLKPLTDEVVKEMMLLNITKYLKMPASNCTVALPTIYSVNFVSKTQCTKTLSCLSELMYNDAIPCDNHDLASVYTVLNGRAYWRELYTVNCGFKCCLVQIRFKCAISPETGNVVPQFLPRQYITTSNCPPSSTIRCQDPDLEPQPADEPVPCEAESCEKGVLE